tara:strand:- start:2741 stop:3865 length:1125 start_codon:yes stop_codon:yes gene_type:complete
MNDDFDENDWIESLYRKSESERTVEVARASLKILDYYCQVRGITRAEFIEKLKENMSENPPNVRVVCLTLNRIVAFMTKDQEIPERKDEEARKFRKKSPKSVKVYFGFIKTFLRIVHGIKITNEDVKDYIQFPKIRKEPRRALPLEVLKRIFNHAKEENRALYYLLVTSGMRLSEGLSLTKSNFHFDEDPIRISIHADDTKTQQGRETFITNEAYEKIKPLINGQAMDEPLFRKEPDLRRAVIQEEQNFGNIRKRLGLTEKYPNSTRYVVNIHALRAYFHTKASRKHGVEYANALDGHSAYLSQYYRHTPEERSQLYKELEPDLFIEAARTEAEKSKDLIIETLKQKIQKIEDKMERDKKFDNLEDEDTEENNS